MEVSRACTPEDWSFIRDLCCRTGRSGEPIETSRRAFFKENWITPYQKLEPSLAFIIRNGDQRVGYLTGCGNSKRFERRRWWRVDLPLYLKTVLRVFPKTVDTVRFAARFRRSEKSPEEFFPVGVVRKLKETYPAHLHMNVEGFARGTGAGRTLFHAYERALGEIGISGIHLFCGSAPVAFYERLGFKIVAKIEFKPDVYVYALGKS